MSFQTLKCRVSFQEFLSFTQSIFGLNEGKDADNFEMTNKETVQQRATTIFNELDSNGDGLVTLEDMVRFFKTFEVASQVRNTTSSHYSNRLPV
ncbi:hypothetical protein GCK32_015710 [Trichostrongylus colubriformis]|uniref:EF-hand domain-containing protein n=1 Tax=Trichostrongylus colubriformis TaxID=6319 RepID=A0AAN8IN90_TRICO